jgi:predicted transcriptional regulator
MYGYKDLERIVRDFSNHRRIQILELIFTNPDLSLIDISAKLKINFKTASEHVRRLTLTDLVEKRNQGAYVRHKISQRGKSILMFLRTLE